MEVQKEAQRIMTMSVWKMYHSRMQRGGLRLHRSLQLSLVMRNARDLYLAAKLEEGEDDELAAGVGPGEDFAGRRPPQLDSPAPSPPQLESLPRAPREASLPSPPPPPPGPVPMETDEGPSRRAAPPKASRKRRSSSLGKMGAADAGLAPSKKAKLAEEEGERQPQRQEGPFPSLARVLQDRFAGLVLPPPAAKGGGGGEPAGGCRQGEGVLSIVVRAVVAF